MSIERHLTGGCHCGRNRFIIQFPSNPGPAAQVVFNTHPSHDPYPATPLPAYLRVPLSWYHSTTVPQHADESRAQIHRVWSSAGTGTGTETETATSMRHFCGFCGAPLSLWSEAPAGEADFIRLALGSLSRRDLVDLEELGCVPGSGEGSGEEEEAEEEDDDDGGEREEEDGGEQSEDKKSRTPGKVTGMEGEEEEDGGETKAVRVTSARNGMRGTVGALPWFDTLTEGSRLGTLRRAKGRGANRSGTVTVEWEIVEWTEDDAGEGPRKRKLGEVEGAAQAGGVEVV